MILSHVANGSIAATIHSTRLTPSGLAEENGRNMAQKGDFNGQMSFAGCLSIVVLAKQSKSRHNEAL